MSPYMQQLEQQWARDSVCLQTLGGLLSLPPGADLPTELPKAIQRVLAEIQFWRNDSINN